MSKSHVEQKEKPNASSAARRTPGARAGGNKRQDIVEMRVMGAREREGTLFIKTKIVFIEYFVVFVYYLNCFGNVYISKSNKKARLNCGKATQLN